MFEYLVKYEYTKKNITKIAWQYFIQAGAIVSYHIRTAASGKTFLVQQKGRIIGKAILLTFAFNAITGGVPY